MQCNEHNSSATVDISGNKAYVAYLKGYMMVWQCLRVDAAEDGITIWPRWGFT